MRLRQVLLFLVVMSMPIASGAQECATFHSTPSNATLLLYGPTRQAAESPATYCSLMPGFTYYLRVDSPGYEPRRIKFSLRSEDKRLEFANERPGAVLRSAVLPGWGQAMSGHPKTGAWAFVLTLGSLSYMLYANLEYEDAKSDFELFSDQAQNAPTEEGQNLALTLSAIASRRANTERQYVIDTAVLTGYVYASNLLEAFLVSASPELTTTDASNVNLKIFKQTNGKAGLRSLLSPGLGQKYMGRYTRGVIYQGGFFASVVAMIEARRDYNLAVDQTNTARDALDAADTVAEIESGLLTVADRVRNERDKEKTRDIWYAVTAGVWLLNVLDALALSEPSRPTERFTPETSYRNSTVQVGIRMRY